MCLCVLQGSGPVDKKIKTADRTDLIPWRPKVTLAPSLILKSACALYAGLLVFELFIKPQPRGAVNAAIIGVVLNCWKQYQLFPNAKSELQSKVDTGLKLVMRCALLFVRIAC